MTSTLYNVMLWIGKEKKKKRKWFLNETTHNNVCVILKRDNTVDSFDFVSLWLPDHSLVVSVCVLVRMVCLCSSVCHFVCLWQSSQPFVSGAFCLSWVGFMVLTLTYPWFWDDSKDRLYAALELSIWVLVLVCTTIAFRGWYITLICSRETLAWPEIN